MKMCSDLMVEWISAGALISLEQVLYIALAPLSLYVIWPVSTGIQRETAAQRQPEKLHAVRSVYSTLSNI